MSKKIKASPLKEYFVHSMIKDVSIEDSILDLIDNCLDGARRQIGSETGDTAIVEPNYEGYHVNINFNNNQFSIEDNCGGIALEAAKHSVFHFGRRANAPQQTHYCLGAFGIGMKRAFFKLGKNIRLHSSTKTEAFSVEIDVNQWAENTEQWDFELQHEPVWDTPGTRIEITNLHQDITRELDTDPVFTNLLTKRIARDYSFPLHDGFKIIINGNNPVKPYELKLYENDEFHPLNHHYRDEYLPDVFVKISVGPHEFPPDDSISDKVQEPQKNETNHFGWYLICNGRVVLAGDKTETTGWGDGSCPKWHPQYHGFMGIVSFYAADPALLPWTTNKRNIDLLNHLYRSVIGNMQNATILYVHYILERKEDLERAKEIEKKALPKPVRELPEHTMLTLPHVSPSPMIVMAEIRYYQPKTLIEKVKKDIGQSLMTNKELGLYLFEYFLDNEVDLD